MATAGLIVAVAIGLILLVPVVAGLLILRAERRGRAVEASCGGCRYPVGATLGTSPRCPECGQLFSEVGVFAPRRRRPLLIVLAMALVSVPILFCGLFIGTHLAGQRRMAAARAAAVEVEAAAEAARVRAMQQLQSAEQAARTAEQAIAPRREAAPPTEPR